MNENFTIGLIGNPNCGKTTLFNALTGSRQHVGNWPGVTVERKTGSYQYQGCHVEVVDLPGTYSLDVVDLEVSLDEKVARDYVHAHEADLIVNIIDASNLERNLYLTAQLAEMRLPLLVVLNMSDVAASKGMAVDAERLAELLGCPVVPLVASEGTGVAPLKQALHSAAVTKPRSSWHIPYADEVEQAIAQLQSHLQALSVKTHTHERWLAMRLLEGDDLALEATAGELAVQARELGQGLGEDLDILVADARYSAAHDVVLQVVQQAKEGERGRSFSDRIDCIVLNRILGIPIFLLVMYLMFMFTINIGSAFIDFFDMLAGTLFVDGLDRLLAVLSAPEWLRVLIANGLGSGIQVVATFIPIIGFLYLFLSVLEDSGYMARAAFVMDRFMRAVGLPGKSFVPLIVGFGCNVPAIMAARTLEHRRDRLLTIAMAPFMSCGARLPVYVLFAAAFFAEHAQNVVFILYLTGILIAVLTGLILKNTLLEGESSPFIMELPAYHLPTLKGVAIHTWSRLKGFIVRAGQLIVPMVLVLNLLSSVGTDGSFGNTDTDRSVLAAVGQTMAPAFAPMGLDEQNWPAVVGIFTGILAKEAVVGTLDATYSALASDSQAPEEEPDALWVQVGAAFATIPANLADALGSWSDPLGLSAEQDPDAASLATFGAMAERFHGSAGAFAYLLFILLYSPCTAAIAAVFQESGRRWTLFVVLWTTGLGYGMATLFYQLSLLGQQPLTSLLTCAAVLLVFALAFLGLWMQSRSEQLAGREKREKGMESS